jgi:hypothetical protein
MINFDINVQNQLILAAMDDFTPNSALPNYKGGQFGENSGEWKSAVIDFIYYSMENNLIIALSGYEGYHLLGPDQIRCILMDGDVINGFDVSYLWDIIHFTGSPKLKRLLCQLKLGNWEAVNSNLCMELEIALKSSIK